MSEELRWEPLTAADIRAVAAIAATAHPSLPERTEVFAEKAALFPAGCRKLLLGGAVCGYGLAHPWALNSVPALDSFLNSLPENPGCLYIHDVAVSPAARGRGAAGLYAGYIQDLARKLGLSAVALTAVYGTDAFWGRFGFRAVMGGAAPAGLAAYGPEARYMVWRK